MEVKVLSRETIVPSSPTPSHLKTFQLCFLDQFTPVSYTPLVFFYPMNNKDDQRLLRNSLTTLKSSLSNTLSHFYLLAGRIIDTSICCSDEGAVFIEASVNRSMSEILKEPNNEFLMKLLPCSVLCIEPIETYAHIIVQANVFSCGGIAISLCLLHKLMDAMTISCFLKAWASINRQSSDSFSKMVCYNYEAVSSLFPQTNLLPFHPKLHDALSSTSEEKSYFRRVVFKAKAISELKAKAKSNDVPNPTCVEVLTGFIWKCAIEAASTRSGSRRPSALTHAVNLRKRMEPPLPESSVGNLFWSVVARYSADRTQVELSELVSLVRESFAEIDDSYIQRLMGDEGIVAVVELVGKRNKLLFETPHLYICSSWRNMKLNEVDFGWGEPVWIGTAGDSNTTLKNLIILLDTVSGDGVEAWMIIEEEEMKLLAKNQEFLEYALLNPSVPIS